MLLYFRSSELAAFSEKILIYKQAFKSLKNNRESDTNHILIIELAGLGDSVILAEFVNELLSLNFQITVAVRKQVCEFWNYAFNHINSSANSLYRSAIEVISIDDNAILDDYLLEFCKASFGHFYKAVFAVSISKLSGIIASFAISKNKYALIEEGRYHKGYRLIFNKFHNAKFTEFYRDRYVSLFRLFLSDFKLTERKYQPLAVSEKKCIVIHPGAKWIPRRWPLEYYSKLLNMLSEIDIKIILVCGSYESDWFSYLKTNNTSKKINFISTDSLTELINIINYGNIFLGNDSGPAHLANYFNIRTIVLWGPGNYNRIRPVGDNVTIIKKDIECRPCRQYINGDICNAGDNFCLKMILLMKFLI